MTRVIAVTQQKGGAGKTTLAAHLGMAWALAGRRVQFVDADPQQSLSHWHAARLRLGAGSTTPDLSTVEGWKLAMELAKARRATDLVIIDTPPHAETAARQAVREADLVLVPVQLSALDFWASGKTLEMIRAERKSYRIILNRVPPRGKAADALRAEIGGTGHPVASATLGNRQAFAASLMKGLTALEAAPTDQATVEILTLADELAALIPPI